MRRSGWTPSIVPRDDDTNAYMMLDDLGRTGRIWPEADAEKTDLETVIADLLNGQYKNPVRVDVSADVALELRRRSDLQQRDIPFYLQDFVNGHEGRYRDIQLRCRSA